MDVCHDWALRSWILSWGPFARVLAPDALVATVTADLHASAARYGEPSDAAPLRIARA
jgi:hypothetical protein